MRIDLLITELDVGGAERCLVGLAKHLTAQGDKVRVISLGPKSPPGRTLLVDQLADAWIETHFLDGYSSIYFPWVLKRLKKLVHADRPDVAQSFLFHANVAASFVYPARNVPWFAGVRVAEPRRWRHPIGGWVARRAQKVVCVSKSVFDWCQRCEKIPMEKLVVAPNGVELHAERSLDQRNRLCDKFELDPSKDILLFVGRLDHQKGFDQLVGRAQTILDRLPNHQMVVLGDGPLASSTAQVHHDRFHCLGWQPNPREWIGASQLLLLPTRYEGMPNVILEAMAERRPVVTMEVEGVMELLAGLNEGQVVPAEQWDTWQRRVCKLANDPSLCKEIGKENVLRVESSFQLSSCLQRYRDLYQNRN